ncbi:MAG: glycine cleavage system protein T [Candidatus Cloacimonetes bacterium 4572_55]|nr:MAG: glycine cleavage system protein T [Candidatus Cloacimonetes bacterium 4572_55]
MAKRKHTPFYENHVAAKGKMVDFGDWKMPIQYTGIIEEHRRVRSTIGLFDVSHMGEIRIEGDDAIDFVQRLTVNDVSKLAVGQVQYSCMCYPNGGIVDDLLVYRFPCHYLLVVNAANVDKDYQWLLDNRADDKIEIKNISDNIAQLALQGPKTTDVLRNLTSIELDKIPFYWFARGKVCDVPMIVSRTGYTGEDGFELYFEDLDKAGYVWDQIMQAGKKYDIQPIGLGARDTLRLEMKYALYGNDIDQTTTPLEAGLGWITKMNKGDFIGRDALLPQKKKRGLKRRLICFEIEGKRVARHGYPVQKEGEEIGHVCSGSFSPSLEKAIGTAYVKTGFHKSGTEIDILIRKKIVSAKIVKPPFYKEGSHL